MKQPIRFPKLTSKQEQDAAYQLLEGFYKKPLYEIDLPIDVDRIVESLGYDLQYGRLAERGHPDTLGLIRFDDKQIWVDSSLSDDQNSIGRYHFTVAHEVGHHVLHKAVLEAQLNQTSLFSQNTNQILCRKQDQQELHEQQADRFAARLLMPSTLVRREFESIRKNYFLSPTTWQFEHWVVLQLKERFQVSEQAMRLRVERVRLLHGLQSQRLNLNRV